MREVGIEVRALVRSSSATSSVSVHDSSTPDGSHLVMVMVRVRIRVKVRVRVRVRVGLGLGLDKIRYDCWVSRRYTTHDATQFRDAWTPHTQTQRYG